MNRRNFFKGVLGGLAATLVGKVVAKPSKVEQFWKGCYPGKIVEVEPLLDIQVKAICHNAGIPYRIYCSKDFDKYLATCD